MNLEYISHNLVFQLSGVIYQNQENQDANQDNWKLYSDWFLGFRQDKSGQNQDNPKPYPDWF